MPILDSVHGKSPRFLEKVLAFLTFLSPRNFLKIGYIYLKFSGLKIYFRS